MLTVSSIVFASCDDTLRIDDEGRWWIDEIVEGDSVSEVLGYMQYEPASLARRLRAECEDSVREGRMTVSESRNLLRAYDSGLAGYTYLERVSGD